ncbi:GL12920 [Drosophila persimilis]|uniref:GL12920 n=1 Tax=Drosophila persimilis TaxID=7234 RepID=B4IRX3_DROPE|nr:GL12920 [Drosophila persimilis]
MATTGAGQRLMKITDKQPHDGVVVVRTAAAAAAAATGECFMLHAPPCHAQAGGAAEQVAGRRNV